MLTDWWFSQAQTELIWSSFPPSKENTYLKSCYIYIYVQLFCSLMSQRVKHPSEPIPKQKLCDLCSLCVCHICNRVTKSSCYSAMVQSDNICIHLFTNMISLPIIFIRKQSSFGIYFRAKYFLHGNHVVNGESKYPKYSMGLTYQRANSIVPFSPQIRWHSYSNPWISTNLLHCAATMFAYRRSLSAVMHASWTLATFRRNCSAPPLHKLENG